MLFMSKRCRARAGRRFAGTNVARVAKDTAASRALVRVRRLCLALPETTERLSHGSPAFYVRDKTTFVMFLDDHHGDGRLALWCAAPPGAQEALVAADPERFFRPPYVGVRGWIGVRLDRGEDWERVAAVIDEAYRTVAPRKLLAQLPTPR
jgi:hypothetical protein